MKIERPKNTKEKGFTEFFFFKKGKKWTGVCLTFDIVESGDDLKSVKESLLEAAQLHLEAVVKNKMSDDLLNRYAPEEYWKMYFDYLKSISKQKVEGGPYKEASNYKLSLNELVHA